MTKTKYRQGKYNPKNIHKYQGDFNNICYRSSWERIVFAWLDRSDACLKWVSEETIIPYISPLDGKQHRYFIDIKATFKQKDGNIKTYLIEIKPYAQTVQPTLNKNRKTLLEAVSTYEVNVAKWEAAKKYCTKMGYEFQIVTEYDIGLKKK